MEPIVRLVKKWFLAKKYFHRVDGKITQANGQREIKAF
jgi:hypothetical protein